MSLVLNLPAELETELPSEAAQLGLPLPEYVLRLLAGGRTLSPAPHTGLVGTRPEIVDSAAHARFAGASAPPSGRLDMSLARAKAIGRKRLEWDVCGRCRVGRPTWGTLTPRSRFDRSRVRPSPGKAWHSWIPGRRIPFFRPACCGSSAFSRRRGGR